MAGNPEPGREQNSPEPIHRLFGDDGFVHEDYNMAGWSLDHFPTWAMYDRIHLNLHDFGRLFRTLLLVFAVNEHLGRF